MKKGMCTLLLSLCIALPFVALADDNVCEHRYVYQYRDNEIVHYQCSKCGAMDIKSITSIIRSWSSDYINSTPNDDTQCFDFVSDNIINAKDYAKIRNEYLKYKRTPDLDIGGGF